MKKLFLAILAASVIFSGCTKTIDSPGRLVVKVTDDPFNISFVESATVTITKVEIRKAGQNEGNPFMVLSQDTVTLDLLNLRNGITSELLNMEVPQGNYDLIRLYVEEAGLKIKDQAVEYKVKVPGGMQTGIKIFISPTLRVGGGLTSELLLDFDLGRSFVMRGNMAHRAEINGFIFKPCIRATNTSTAGRIDGVVKDTAKINIVNAKVWFSQDTVMATAFTDTLGRYAFIGVPAGTYSVFATKENYDTASATGVKVIEGNMTLQNFILQKK